MIKFCPSCGEGLEKVGNFCPNCGYNLKEIQNNSTYPGKNSSAEKSIICEVCGEENPPGSAVCSSCGAILESASSVKIRSKDKSRKEPNSKVNKSKKQNPDSQPLNYKAPFKLDNTIVISIIGISAAVVFIILLLAGVFDSSSKLKTQINRDGQNQSQISLQNVQRINELEKQLKSEPNNAVLILELAHLRNDSGFNEKAIENYRQYLKIHPEDADARVDMGVCFYKERRYNEAIETMETALKYQPKHQIAHLNLGIVNLAAGNLEKSKEWLQKAYDLNPNSEIGQKAKELIESHTQQIGGN
jgi:Tfp pilus assembly protein PilF